ncbi:hypothetical protein ACE41H_21085 [Paenibacillus enshidis]|uniref:Uncharacterized protein n=1 Tax=Paenibacillus enshidis TaxID=1458439 RepID=A0ABV5AYF5_9BACL
MHNAPRYMSHNLGPAGSGVVLYPGIRYAVKPFLKGRARMLTPGFVAE